VHPGSPYNEERRLLAEYETATHLYSWAVRELSLLPASHEDYTETLALAEDARRICEDVRCALDALRGSINAN
jgi:hypothetical protein